MFINNFKKILHPAFTIAEILIVLAIIGVVSAMTLIIIKNSLWESEQKAFFRKSYATMNTVLLDIKADLGYIPRCYYTLSGPSNNTECSSFYTELKNHLRIAKICPDNAYSGGCVPFYADKASESCAGVSQSNINNVDTVFVLQDGTIIIIYGKENFSMPLFAIDINGASKPNKWGYDLFNFVFREYYNDTVRISPTTCFTPEDGGKTSDKVLKYSLFN